MCSFCVQREVQNKMRAAVLKNNHKSIGGILTQLRTKMKLVWYNKKTIDCSTVCVRILHSSHNTAQKWAFWMNLLENIQLMADCVHQAGIWQMALKWIGMVSADSYDSKKIDCVMLHIRLINIGPLDGSFILELKIYL